MIYLKNFAISFLYSIVSLLFLMFVFTVLNYFNVINSGLFMIFNIVFSIFLGSFILSKNGNNKGWLEGIKFGVIYIIFISLLNIFAFNFKFSLKYIVFLLILLISSIFGGMVGINFKKKK